MERENTCCFTGHRPDKLPWGTDEGDPRCLAMKAALERAAEEAYGAGCRHFMCGMARGCDLYFAQAVLALRARCPDVTLEGVRPCESQADGWPARERALYREILDRCDFETLIQHRYDRFCMMRRNRYMVDRSGRIIAVYNGVPGGGTAWTLRYALGKNLPAHIIRLEEFTR